MMRLFYEAAEKVGRKFLLAWFAGTSSFLIAAAGMWIIARVETETARIISDVISAYLLAATGLVTAYSASNTVIERAHAMKGAAAATQPSAAPRQSGTISQPSEEENG